MKSRTVLSLMLPVLLLLLAIGLGRAQGPESQAISGTAFTYQGQLQVDSSPANGTCDFQFSLWDASSGGSQIGTTQTKTNVQVAKGLFFSQVDFGLGAFQGDARYLGIKVRCPAGSGAYTTLSPRQLLTAAPYALALPGLWTQPNATRPNIIGGYSGNSVTSGVVGATIGGGGASGNANRVTDNHSTIGGGLFNQAGDNAGGVTGSAYATVGGGLFNVAGGTAATVGGGGVNAAGGDYATTGGGNANAARGDYATVGGGYQNVITGTAEYATIGGGKQNTANGTQSTIAGGAANTADYRSTVGGGLSNSASGQYATVPGGYLNTAGGNYSFAAGQRAKANHQGAFVWADSTNADFASIAYNEFAVRASGGVRFVGNDFKIYDSAGHLVFAVDENGTKELSLNLSWFELGPVPWELTHEEMTLGDFNFCALAGVFQYTSDEFTRCEVYIQDGLWMLRRGPYVNCHAVCF